MIRWTDEQLAAYRALRRSAQGKDEPMARAKYRNKKTEFSGMKFDSKSEASRFIQLRRMEEAGLISELRRQVPFELAPAVKITGKNRMSPPLRYFADFVYVQDGKKVVEDVKGQNKVTEGYRIKRHLMKSVLGIDVVEVRNKMTRKISIV